MLKLKKQVFAILLLGILITQLVSAASFDFNFAQNQISRVMDSVMGILSPFFEKILGNTSTSEFFFHQILILLLLILIIKKILDKTPFGEGNAKLSFLISTIVSILAVRFIVSNNFFEMIFLQYGVLGIAITTILPMVLFFYFIQVTNVGSYGRKFFWVFYIIVLIILWLMKAGEIPEAGNWIYIISIFAAIVLIFFDKKIHIYFGTAHLRAFMAREDRETVAVAKERIHVLQERLRTGIIGDEEFRKLVNEQKTLIKELSGEE